MGSTPREVITSGQQDVTFWNDRFQFQVPNRVAGRSKGGQMNDLATYRRFAEECLRLAEIGPEEDRHILLEHAAAWTKLAEESERQHKADPTFG
jgi:hypothetical protein